MRTPLIFAALLLLAAGVRAESDSVLVGHATLRLGMSEADVSAVVGKELTLQKFADRVPAGSTYLETHGTHEALVQTMPPGKWMASLVFEDGKVTRVTRLLGDFADIGAGSLVNAMAAALDALGRSGEVRPVVRTTSWSDGHSEFRSIEFRAGSKQVLVTVSPGGRVQLVENLGRGDVPEIRVSN